MPSLFFDEVNIEMPKKKLNLKKGDVIEFNTISGEIRVGYFVMITQNGELLVSETADLRLKLKCLVKIKNFIQKL